MEDGGNSDRDTTPEPASAVVPGKKLGKRGLIERTEFVRVIIQCLYSLGYRKSAAALELESGVPLDSPLFSSLLPLVIAGQWEDCVDIIGRLEDLPEETRATAAFLVWSESFMELLNSTGGEDGTLSSALNVLRQRISPLGVDRRRVHKLARCLVSLEGASSPCIRLPGQRLEHLVEMALLEQRASCIYHNSTEPISLYEDHKCDPDQIPSQTVQILNDHKNEVWFVQFSNNGEFLASSSKDCTAIIWTVGEDDMVSLKHVLDGHCQPVSFVAWSPDDTLLITCGKGEVLRLWDVETGACRCALNDSSVCVISSCAWFPDSKKVVCGSSEPENCIYTLPKVSSLAVTPDGRHLVSVVSDDLIRIYDLEEGTELAIPEEHTITSLSLSVDGQFMIVNLNNEIHLWKVDGSLAAPSKYRGHKQVKYVIRSCFGGPASSFIASGSEDSQVYIWHRERCVVIKVLPGHATTVNCVSWNPARPRMLASASDDHTIRIWVAGSTRP
ncbi:unnamed protein product [Spirodela intermedia]|uniref:Uncharacterized protein n=1 Tax=Spirodela intermedia TaxID=51605 RepID=A0A7I8IES9_SPIIN|nr:unnamed protein product [Spirodela intermedia]CAA6655362.1 unnamed protein product [Spirodela intermedia]